MDLHCPLCYQVYLDPVSTPCRHSYCAPCIAAWVDARRVHRGLPGEAPCPTCRTIVREEACRAATELAAAVEAAHPLDLQQRRAEHAALQGRAGARRAGAPPRPGSPCDTAAELAELMKSPDHMWHVVQWLCYAGVGAVCAVTSCGGASAEPLALAGARGSVAAAAAAAAHDDARSDAGSSSGSSSSGASVTSRGSGSQWWSQLTSRVMRKGPGAAAQAAAVEAA